MWSCSSAGCKLHSCVLLYIVALQAAKRKNPYCILGVNLYSCALTNITLHSANFESVDLSGCVGVLPAAFEMLVWIRAVCTHSVLPLCSSHMGRSLPNTKDSYLLIVFKAAFRKIIILEDGYNEIRPSERSLV